MTISFELFPDRRLVVAACSGRVTGKQLEQHLCSLPLDSGFSPDFTYLCDFSQVTDVYLTPECVQRLALVSPFRASACVLLVIPRASRGITSCAINIGQGSDVPPHKTFDARHEAYEWLLAKSTGGNPQPASRRQAG